METEKEKTERHKQMAQYLNNDPKKIAIQGDPEFNGIPKNMLYLTYSKNGSDEQISLVYSKAGKRLIVFLSLVLIFIFCCGFAAIAVMFQRGITKPAHYALIAIIAVFTIVMFKLVLLRFIGGLREKREISLLSERMIYSVKTKSGFKRKTEIDYASIKKIETEVRFKKKAYYILKITSEDNHLVIGENEILVNIGVQYLNYLKEKIEKRLSHLV